MSEDDLTLSGKLKDRLIDSKQKWAADGRLLTGKTAAHSQRLPPGQRRVENWPVLDLGIQPEIPLHAWRLIVDGAVEQPMTFKWAEFTYNNDDAKRREIALGDLVTVGDVGYQDADGYVFLCDRKRDMIISGGVNIYPAEIESVLIQMPGVRYCAVFGIPDEEFGEQICAHVEPQGGAEIGRAHV